ncbi:hypothetical protein N9Y31_03370 [Alphaproteobacteria bacterium]|nr:hypothetical protein [Alphaproteobacteria bacterium]
MADINQLMTALRNADAAGDTVAAKRLAALIKQAQGGQTQPKPVQAPEPGVMESLGRGIADRATGIAAGITELPDTVAEAVTGFKDPRLLVPGDADQFMGVDWRNIGDTKFVKNTPDIQKLQNPLGFTGDEFENTGKFLRDVQKDIDYQRITPWNEVKSNPTPQNVLAFMGEAAVTSLPDMAAALLATPAYFASYISPIAEERAKNDGRDQVTPEDLSIAATASLAIAGAERFGAKGIFGGQTGNMVTRPIKAGVKESGTEAIQETTQYGAETAGTQAGFNPAQAADQALAGAVGGFGAGTGLRATTDAVTAIAGQDINARAVAEDLIAKGDVLNPKLVGNDPQAATELATRLDTIAKANDLNLKDVNKQSTSGAREAVDKAHIQVSEELKQLAKDLRTQLGITDSDELSVVLDKVMAIAGQRQARNKAKSTVGVQEMQAIERLAGNTQEGQRMLSLMRQMNELTTLHNSGYVGGVSKITDQLSPIPSNVGYSDRSLIETPTRILGTLYGASVNPVIPAIQGAAVIGGRGIDAITGRRSRVATYIKDNINKNEGIKISDDAESVRETRRQETEGIKKANQEQRARAKEIHKSQYEKNGDLPFITLDAMLKERGLSPQRAVQLLEAMAAADPVIAADARAMIKAIQEGGRAPNMTAVGAAMSTALDQQSTSVTRDKAPVPGASQAAAASAAAPRDVSAGYVRGIQDNQDANTALIEAVDADPTISDDDKAVLIDALADLRSNLGANPADQAMDIAAKAESQVSDPALVETYVMPYVNRVIGQQASTQEETNFMPEINEMRTIDFMDNPPSIEGTGKKGVVTVEDVGRFLEAESIKAGSKAPRTVRGGKETNTIDYTDELKERLFQDILAEAKEFYKTNPGAAYWYTFGSPQALDMMSSVIPELREDPTSNNPDNGLPLQLLFWTLISPLSGGQNPVANAKLAVDVLRYYIENGRIPLSKYKGGLFINDANVDAKEAVGEELAWTARGSTTRNALAAIQKGIDTFGDLESFMMWMVSPHPAAEVTQMYMDLGFGSEESAKNIAKYADADGMVYGSQVLGAKFSPFLLNNSGNESKVTKDEWFTRSWNRLVGRMFTANGKEMLSQPSSPEERMVQDEVISRVAAELDLEPAQLQALWWAYEQQLYTKMGVNSPTRDYVDAATEVIKAIAGEAEAANAEREGRARLSTLVAEQTQRAQGSNAAESINRQQGVLDFDDGGNNGRAGDTELPKTSLAGSREPTPEENREALSVVKAAFEVGKLGSPYENGIRDYDTISKIGQAFNHVFHLATSQTDLAKKLQVPRKKLKDTKGARVALPSPEGYKLGKGARFGIIQSKAKKDKSSDIFAALHELSHAIETSYVDEAARQEGSENLGRDFYSPLSQQTINDPANNATYSNTFRAVIRELLELFGDKKVATGEFTNQDARDIINEVIRMQRTGILEGFGTKFPVRNDYSKGMELVSKGKVTQSTYDSVIREGERTYFQTPYELPADLLAIYMFDPKLAKREMPKATKLVRLLLKDNPNIQFFSAPFSAVVAMVMANMLLAEKEDEEEKALLTLGRGALTA